MITQDNAVTVSPNGTMEVDTFEMNDQFTGFNDFGEKLYMFDGVEMTEDQLMQNANFFESDDYDDGYYADDVEDSLPEPIVDRLYQVNDALGGEGAADFLADELLGINEHSRMDEIIRATGQSREEIQSHANAVLMDMEASLGAPTGFLAQELAKDIATVRSLGSDFATQELHEAITMAVAGNYEGAYAKWDRLRYAMKSVR